MNTCKDCGKEITKSAIRCRNCQNKVVTNYERIRLVLLYHDNGATMTEASMALHTSRQRVDQIYKKERGRYWKEEEKAKIIAEAQKSLLKLKEHGDEIKFRCKYCKKPVIRKEAGRRTTFCSTACGTLYRSISGRNNKIWVVCIGCGIKFHPWRSSGLNQKFHNQKCYHKNIRLRGKGKR